MDVWTYFEQKEKEIRELSLVPRRPFNAMCAEEEGSAGMRGRIFGTLDLTERAFIHIHEVVVVEGNNIHREEYGYFFVVDDDEVWGYERDPSHVPAVHAHHGKKHVRKGSEPVAFRKAVEQAWYDLEDLIPAEAG